MKTTIKLFIVLALAIAGTVQSSPASAADKYTWKGPGADANFYSESGCIATTVFVVTREESFQNPPGQPSQGTFVYVTINQFDYCSQAPVSFAEGWSWVGESDLQIARRLDVAALITTVNVYDWLNDTSYDVYVDLSWTATEGAVRQSGSFRTPGPGCQLYSRFRGSSRAAEVNGTVSDGSTNFTPTPGWGSLFDYRSMDLYIGCN